MSQFVCPDKSVHLYKHLTNDSVQPTDLSLEILEPACIVTSNFLVTEKNTNLVTL